MNKIDHCNGCKHRDVKIGDYPCCECVYSVGKKNCYSPIPQAKAPEVKAYEEINHPERYNNNGYECIDVMEAIFGKEAVMAFCKLNAFKYIWRSEKKGHTEDLKKAIWYLNKNVELAEGKTNGKDTVL